MPSGRSLREDTEMALKALDIYKILPKKNCKECGDPTCLTFAMKLAQGKVDPSLCPYLDEQAKELLGASTRPPIQKVTIGMGTRSCIIGEEFVFYRHEKTFYHQPGYIYLVSDTNTPEEITRIRNQVRDDKLTRIGIDLTLNGIAVRSDSRSSQTFANAVRIVNEGNDFPIILISEDPSIMEAGLEICGNFSPLIHAVTHENFDLMIPLSKKYGAPLVVRTDSLESTGELIKKCLEKGVANLVIDLTRENAGLFLKDATISRQLALSRTSPELGYPIYLDTTRTGPGSLITGTIKFASVIITKPISEAEMKAALVLRQNIFTDPQKPIQITPGLYRVGEPGRDAPVFMTVNFSLTYFTLQGYLESTRKPCWLLIVETEGLSVLTAVAAGKLNESVVAEWMKNVNLESEVDHRKLIIPGYASPLSGRIEEVTGWKVLVGPRDAAEIGEFLEQEWT